MIKADAFNDYQCHYCARDHDKSFVMFQFNILAKSKASPVNIFF